MVIVPSCRTHNSTGKTKYASPIKLPYIMQQVWLRDCLFELGCILPSIASIEIYRHETSFRYHKHGTIESTSIKHDYYYDRRSYRQKCVHEALTTFRKLVRSILDKLHVPKGFRSHAAVSKTNPHSMYNKFVTANR